MGIRTEALQTNEEPPDRPFITPKEAAAYMGVTLDFIMRRLKNGSGPPWCRWGPNYRLPRAAFMEWAKQKIIK